MDFYDHTGFEEIQSYYKGDSDKAVRKGISSVTEKEIWQLIWSADRDQVYQKLYATMGQRFDASLFHESVSDIDDRLGENLETFYEQAYQNRALWKMELRKNSLSNWRKKCMIINGNRRH